MNVLNFLQESWKNEQKEDSLLSLPDTIADSLKKQIEPLSDAMIKLNPTSLQFEIIQKEIQLIKFLWQDLLKLRRQKIERAIAAGIPVDTSTLLPFEEAYHGRQLEGLQKYMSEINILPSKQDEIVDSEQYTLVRFLAPVDGIMGLDLRPYGPFKKEDVAYIPQENALLLKKSGKVKEITLSRHACKAQG